MNINTVINHRNAIIKNAGYSAQRDNARGAFNSATNPANLRSAYDNTVGSLIKFVSPLAESMLGIKMYHNPVRPFSQQNYNHIQNVTPGAVSNAYAKKLSRTPYSSNPVSESIKQQHNNAYGTYNPQQPR